jgi:hypothetical protein
MQLSRPPPPPTTFTTSSLNVARGLSRRSFVIRQARMTERGLRSCSGRSSDRFLYFFRVPHMTGFLRGDFDSDFLTQARPQSPVRVLPLRTVDIQFTRPHSFLSFRSAPAVRERNLHAPPALDNRLELQDTVASPHTSNISPPRSIRAFTLHSFV